jgi:electron transfer flavoprotein alpha subunit
MTSASIDLLVAGASCDTVVKQAQQLAGIDRVLYADSETARYPQAENFAPWITGLMKDYCTLVMGATTWGKDLLPHIGALMDVQPITDIVQILNPSTFKRPIYAGSALEVLASQQPVKLLSLRPSAFVGGGITTISVPVLAIAPPAPTVHSQYVGSQQNQSGLPELTSARVVVSGGRGLQMAENFSLLYQLADKLHAAVGASRAAVDAGFVGNELQVGQTGKVVAPELYLAIGLSGAVQHQAGMRESRVIVAINKDPDAPIFQIADYGLVADLFDVIPELIEQL